MLKVPTEFPMPGSEALYRAPFHGDEVKVRIVSIDGSGRPLILGKGVNCRVEMHRLRAYAEPRAAIDLWADKRVASVLYPASTRAADAWADFKRWYQSIYQAPVPIDHSRFKRGLQDRGFVIQRGKVGLSWAFALAPERAAA